MQHGYWVGFNSFRHCCVPSPSAVPGLTSFFDIAREDDDDDSSHASSYDIEELFAFAPVPAAEDDDDHGEEAPAATPADYIVGQLRQQPRCRPATLAESPASTMQATTGESPAESPTESPAESPSMPYPRRSYRSRTALRIVHIPIDADFSTLSRPPEITARTIMREFF